MYYYPQPPFLICLIGLFVGLIFGLTFQTILKQKVNKWLKDGRKEDLAQIEKKELKLAYLGICLGVWIFLTGGLLLFSTGLIVAVGLALPLTVLSTSLIWNQLIDVLQKIQKGGSKALELDSWI
ncbi:MAG: hypothetical protein AB4368_09190 [Xenococcaceae cyanobacterium]